MFFKFLMKKPLNRFEILKEGNFQIDEKYIKRNKDGDIKLIPFFWQFFKNGWFVLLLIFIFSQIQNSGNSVLIPYFTKELLNTIEKSPKELLFDNGLYYVIILILISVLSYFSYLFSRIFLQRLFITQKVKEIRLSLFNFLQKHSFRFYTDQSSGKLNSKVGSTLRVFTVLQNIFWFYSYIIFGTVINSIIFFHINKVLGSLLLLSFVLMGLVYYIFNKPIKESSKIYEEQSSKTSGVYIDCLTNFLNMKLFSSKRKEEKFLYKEEDSLKYSTRDKEFVRLGFSSSSLFIMRLIASPLFFLFGLYYYSKGLISFGDLSYSTFMFTSLLYDIYFLFNYLGNDLDTISEIRSALKTILQPIEIKDKDDAKKLVVKDGKIEFKNVSFAYNKKVGNVLDKFNLTIEAGQKVGIVGHSGSGKTTFMNLLLRFYDKQKGKILIDGQEIQDITQDSLRSNISVVPQDSVLFDRSLKENISYSKPNAKKSDLERVAKDAYALDFIKDSTKGWNTIVGERGIKLSGGQKQRVAIARAMLKDAPIIFLDEATSALDSETEAHIQDSFSKLMKGKTSLVVAHRLSTLKHLDRIIVLDKGKIVQDGTHAQLVREKGIYKDLWDKQVGGFVVE